MVLFGFRLFQTVGPAERAGLAVPVMEILVGVVVVVGATGRCFRGRVSGFDFGNFLLETVFVRSKESQMAYRFSEVRYRIR